MNMGRFETRFIRSPFRLDHKESSPPPRSADRGHALIKGYVVDHEELADAGVLDLLNKMDRRARRVSL